MEKMKIETIVKLNKFLPRPYQLNLCMALEEKGYKKLLAVWCRRAGKDFTVFNLILRQALKRVGTFFYCLPTFKQARLVIWQSIDNSGNKLLDCIPKELISKMNESEMRIELINGSIIQLIGSDTYDTALVGTNAVGIVFSEFSRADDRAYKFVRPILNANEGFVIIISTPFGRNHFYDLYQIAKNNPEDWFCEVLTMHDTGHISHEQIQKEVAMGEMSQEMANQEYLCDFSSGVEGSYYARYIDKMRLEGRISDVPYEPAFPVHCAFDLGMKDSTAIVFFQAIGTVIHIIDYYENHSQGLEHYARHLHSKDYYYGRLIAPHDIAVRELGSGMSRLEKARELGLDFEIAPRLSINDGIEAVRTTLPRCWIDEKKCSQLIKSLENYRKEFDHKRKVYNDKPLHDRFSDACDGFRYACVSLSKLTKQSSPEELDSRYREVVYGHSNDLPFPFNK